MDSGEEKHFGRVFHKRVRAKRLSDNLVRIYKIGDTVVMKGENDDTWTAQIVELFESTEDDEELREVLQIDLRKINNGHGYELMRVTLRWFYNPADMNMHTLRSSSCPNHIKNEIYFSDHVEKEGYNDITVIEGKAWLVPTKRQREEFLQSPNAEYKSGMDTVRIVRCFVNSLSPELAVRELDTGELSHLIKNPTADKDLFETSRQRMRGLMNSNGTIIRPPSKGTGSKPQRRKRSRTIREPIDIEDIDDNEFDPRTQVNGKDKREPKVERSFADVNRAANRDRKERRKKQVIIVDDGEDTVVPDSESMRMQSLKQANEEVLDLVASLNQSALPTDNVTSAPPVGKGDDDFDVVHVDGAAPRSGAQHAVSAKMPVATASRVGEQRVKESRKIVPNGNTADDARQGKRVKASLKPTDGQGANSKKQDVFAGKGRKPPLKDARSDTTLSKQEKIRRRDAIILAGKEASREQQDAKVSQVRESIPEPRSAKRMVSGDPPNVPKESKKVRVNDDPITKTNGKKKEGSENKSKRKAVVKGAATSSQKETGDGDAVDWWEETRSVLKKLDKEFKSMSTTAQELFRSHAEIAFELAVAKVTERGLFGKIATNNEQLVAITKEILDELKSVMSDEADAEGGIVMERQGDTDVVMKPME